MKSTIKNVRLTASRGIETSLPEQLTLGLDLGDKQSRLAVLDSSGELVEESSIQTSPAAFRRFFQRFAGSVIAMEVGTHSPWASELLRDLGLIVYVANPRQLGLIYANKDKDDRLDAERLARLARADSKLLHPVVHRAKEKQQDLEVIKARESLVNARKLLVNHVRGVLKSLTGNAIKKCSTRTFAAQAREVIPEPLIKSLTPLLDTIEDLTAKIRVYERDIDSLAAEKYSEASKALQQVNGVGPITSLAFILTIDNPHRFKKSRDVGCYLGLRPRRCESGDFAPQLRITRAGDNRLRALLVQCAHYVLGPFGKDSDLRRWGLRKAESGGKTGKKKAIVAVARKLAVLLHRLWVTRENYEPLKNSKTNQPESSAA